jgi:prepilin-type N-terminal cleavage/methylation domain-containing protein/prepilin-type processing-associated H-X9-DG protein
MSNTRLSVASPTRAPLKHRGFTLLELLAVIAVIGILTALLLPAIHSAREAARRLSCQSHSRQLGIALHAHHDSRRRFPAGSTNEWSWNVWLLPQLEEKSVYEQYDFDYEPFEDPNFDRVGIRISVLLCPSDPHSAQTNSVSYLDGAEFGHTNYLGSYDGRVSRGMFGFERGVRIKEVKDGSSKTIFVGERGVVSDGADTHGWWPWGSATMIASQQEFRRGRFEDPESATHWWSHHPNGGVFLFVDGSVRFLPYAMDNKTFLGLGTKDGGEFLESY